ncbi:MAG TPA: efflux transporter outer membrane subunit [Vicinamibacteria bacterium]|nr:efflux transporter outer membrane subunit [Vicinamibacteria bacterium]
MRPRRVGLAAAALALGGCTMIPKYDRPAMPVPPSWAQPVALPDAAPGGATAATRWQEFFTDRRLVGVIELALANNRDLRIATLNVERTQALYRIQRSFLYPTVGVLASVERTRTPEGSSFNGQATTTAQYSVDLGFTGWELDFFGRLRSLKASALQQYLASGEARRAAQVSLVASVASAWLALAADSEGQTLAQATLDAQQAVFGLLQRSRDAGIASELDVRQAQTQVETARVALAALKGQIAADRDGLDVLAGTPVPPDLLPPALSTVQETRPLSPGLPSEVLLTRPDILAAEHRLLSANADIGAARAAFFPRISLTAALGTMSGELGILGGKASALFGSGTGTWTLAPQIAAPIWTGGYNRANLQATRVERQIAVATYEKAIQQAFAEVSDGLALRGTLLEQRQAQEALVTALDETYRLSQARYKAGIDSYLAVLVAQRALFAGQLSLIGVRLSEQVNLVTLYKVLGGGA